MHVSPKASIAFAIAISASPALAQTGCPVGPQALDTGVTVSLDGIEIDYVRQANGRIMETERHADGSETWFYISDPSGLMFGSWMQGPDGAPDETTREVYSYDFAGGMPLPQASSSFSGRETSIIDGVTEVNSITWDFSKETAYQIGACRYRAIWVHETRTQGGTIGQDPPWLNHYVHLIDLGLSIYLGGDEVGVDPVLDTPLSISARTP